MEIIYEKVDYFTDFVNHSNFYAEKMHYTIVEEENWNLLVDSVEFDFSNSHNQLILKEQSVIKYKTVSTFQKTLDDYLKEKKQKRYIKNISEKAAKNFLYLIPTIENFMPNINIDADTGYVNITFTTYDNGVLSALVTDKSEIHYSRVSKDKKIYKISGVVKIKDTRDFNNFTKVLRML